MSNKPYRSLIDSALDDFRNLGPGLMGEGAKVPTEFRGQLGPSATKLFEKAGMDPDYFENWWWLLTTLAEIHFEPQKKKDGWNDRLNEQLLEAVAFLKLSDPTLSNLEICKRLSRKRTTGLEISHSLRRKIDATKNAASLYRQFRYAVQELESAAQLGLSEPFAPTSLLKLFSQKAARGSHKTTSTKRRF